MKRYFEDMDFTLFWDDRDYALKEYVGEPISEKQIRAIEAELGYKLPGSYIELMRAHNGGMPVDTCFPTETATTWAEDHVAITGIYGMDRNKPYSLCGDQGTAFWIEEWEYPEIGVVICDTPSAGHDLIMLDYRECGPEGEPQVVHVDQEWDYEITVLAKDFETFIRGLVNDSVYDTSEADRIDALERVRTAAFSPLLGSLCSKTADPDGIERKIRAVCTQIIEDKGYFALHADERSLLMYDVQFWLYTGGFPGTQEKKYLKEYEKMIAFGGAFGTGGYAPDFIKDWMTDRKCKGMIVESDGGIGFSKDAIAGLMARLAAY